MLFRKENIYTQAQVIKRWACDSQANFFLYLERMKFSDYAVVYDIPSDKERPR